MIGGFKTVNLAWINKVAMNGYTWLFVYENACRYEERVNAAPEQESQSDFSEDTNVTQFFFLKLLE